MRDSSNHPHQKDKISKVLGILSIISGVMGFLSSISTLIPAVSQNVSWLTDICAVCVITCILLFGIAAYLWCSERMEAIDQYIEMSEKKGELIECADKRLQAVSGSQTICRSLADDAKTVLQAVRGQMTHMENVMSGHSNFRYCTGEVTKLLEDFVYKHLNEITEVHIVCFGRNGYEQAINYIVEKCRNISVKVIFCHTEKNAVICREGDEGKIKDTIKDLLKKCREWNTKIEIRVSDIPPAIRASIVYAGNKRAVWGAIQSYNFEWEGDQLTLVRPEQSLIIVGDDKSVKSDFDGIISCIKTEFDRLGKSAKLKAELKGDEVVFCDVKQGNDKQGNGT